MQNVHRRAFCVVLISLCLGILIAGVRITAVSARTDDSPTAPAPPPVKTGERNIHHPPRSVYGETEPGSDTPALYIVQLDDAPLATYSGGLANLAATSPRVTGTRKLDVRSSAGVAPTIIGGAPAEPGAWPWQAALVYANIDDASLGQFCGGSLISANWC